MDWNCKGRSTKEHVTKSKDMHWQDLNPITNQADPLKSNVVKSLRKAPHNGLSPTDHAKDNQHLGFSVPWHHDARNNQQKQQSLEREKGWECKQFPDRKVTCEDVSLI
ncbi:hypothetical protein FXO38_33289 [Capsicum annuum]|nr:hypothetical protein FXO38_33289 [Capsicum annuum]KAF3646759.1 hypothetical protein FXO37_20297 [Capsicum annuum]